MSNTTTTRAPALFLGHGSPMNAVDDNAFTRSLTKLGQRIPTPKAIVCVSAHWLTKGVVVTHMDAPRTIHDFYGFPQVLFDVQYPAPGSPQVADTLQASIKAPPVARDDSNWGLDHGTWSVLKHMYPAADIPVVQLSISILEPSQFHFDLGKQLRALREQGVMIVGSGNIVHNLRRIRWEDSAQPFDWALEFDEWVKEHLQRRDVEPLLNEIATTEAARLSIPTRDHYYPLLYTLGAAYDDEPAQFEFEGIQNGSISMRCVSYGLGTTDA